MIDEPPSAEAIFDEEATAELHQFAPSPARIDFNFSTNADAVLLQAHRLFHAEHVKPSNVALKRSLLGKYDVPGMTRAANLMHGGRTGSFLLASYLDWHPDIVMLPMLAGVGILAFFRNYPDLSLWEKLIAYPEYSGLRHGSAADFFLKDNPDGDIAIDRADYYAAVEALFDAYADRPATWLNERARFMQFLHAAYALATGREPGTPRPLILYSQHEFDEERARLFIEDFPDGKFIHTIRDPITGMDSWFDRQMEMEMGDSGNRPQFAARYLDPAVATVRNLLTWDRSHAGFEERSRAVRFEDMHLAPEATMRRLAEWLDIPYAPCLLESTWNGKPYVVVIRGVSWCGPNPANVRRRWKNLSPSDRLVIFALQHHNFVAWDYPSPAIMRKLWARFCTIALCWILPMKIERITARAVLTRQAWPGLRAGRIGFFLRAPLFVLTRRVRMMGLIATEARARLTGARRILKAI